MKKQEIKQDPIRDRMIGVLNQINDNPKSFLKYILLITIILLVIIFYSNSQSNRLDEYNLNISINQNRYIDGDRETAITNFSKILNDYSKSESYNQAFIYSINDAIENNDNAALTNLIEENRFNSSDPSLQSLFYNILGNFYTSNHDYDQGVNYYKKAIKSSNIDDHIYQFKLNLLYLYYNIENYSEYTSLLNDIDKEEIKSFQIKSKYEQLPIVN